MPTDHSIIYCNFALSKASYGREKSKHPKGLQNHYMAS